MAARSMLVVVLILSTVLPAAAQSGVGFGPQVGLYKVRDVDGFRLMGGAALRLRLSGAFGVEGSVNYRSDDYADGTVNARSWPVMLTGLLYPLPAVYGAIGAGWYNTTLSSTIPVGDIVIPIASETSQEFGWHFGGGLEVPLGAAMRLVGDIRYVFLDYTFTNFPGTNGVNSNFYVVTAGLLFNL